MQVNLSEIMNRRNETVSQSVPIEFEVYKRCGVEYPVRECSEVNVTLCSHGVKRVLVKADAKVVLSAVCDRCLKEVELPFDIHHEEEFDFSKDEHESAEDLDEVSYISGYDLDIDGMIFEDMLLDFPTKVLCREDCKGICRVCGADLNQGECGCDREVLDPRMAAIRDIFNNFKEV